MKKKIRVFLCLLFAVILPFSFVACKNKIKTINNDNNNVGSGDNPNSPRQEYVIDNKEANKLISDSETLLREFIDDINESNILKNNSYSSIAGTKTCDILGYAFYPALFKEVLNDSSKTIELNKTFWYETATNQKKYFNIVSNSNENLTIYLYSKDGSPIDYFKYKFSINSGTINSIQISYLRTVGKDTTFADTIFDFKNSIFENAFGILDKTFNSNDFTVDNFVLIDSDCWSKSYYEKIVLGENESLICNTTLMPNNQELTDFSSSFEFYKISEFSASLNISSISVDYFTHISSNSTCPKDKYSYNETNFTFDKIEED